MKNLLSATRILFVSASALLFSLSSFAAPKEVLNERLNMHQSFSADFTQKVTSPEGDVLMDAKGTANILRPSMFRWETKTPDENTLVSDGNTVWYYDPFMSQVSIMSQDKATAQTPFVLLTRNQESDWQQYNVVQSQDTFTLTDTNGQAGKFVITIDDTGLVKSFQTIEQDGQKSEFRFNNVKYFALGTSQFTFKVPQGVDIDDQR